MTLTCAAKLLRPQPQGALPSQASPRHWNNYTGPCTAPQHRPQVLPTHPHTHLRLPTNQWVRAGQYDSQQRRADPGAQRPRATKHGQGLRGKHGGQVTGRGHITGHRVPGTGARRGGGREREVRVVGHGARRCMGVALRGHSTYAHTRTTSTYPDAEVFMGRLKVIRTSFDTSDRAAAT